MKKLVAMVLIFSMAVLLCGCDNIFGGKKKESASNRGFSFYFDNEEYIPHEQSLDNTVYFDAPNMTNEGDRCSRVYKNNNEVLFVWLGDRENISNKDKKEKKLLTSNVLNKCANTISSYVSAYTGLDTIDVSFNLDKIAEDIVNNIERYKYVGSIQGIDKRGIDTGLKTVLYTFVVANRPGCVVGIVLNESEEYDVYNEIENNSQVLINTMRE